MKVSRQMTRPNLRHLLLALCASLALAACGSSDNDDAPPVARTTDVPASAQQSVGGLIAYINELIATMTNDTSEPILVGDATLPTSDTTEPTN